MIMFALDIELLLPKSQLVSKMDLGEADCKDFRWTGLESHSVAGLGIRGTGTLGLYYQGLA